MWTWETFPSLILEDRSCTFIFTGVPLEDPISSSSIHLIPETLPHDDTRCFQFLSPSWRGIIDPPLHELGIENSLVHRNLDFLLHTNIIESQNQRNVEHFMNESNLNRFIRT
jgi:hypothetical protein